jgi:threonine dehydratase
MSSDFTISLQDILNTHELISPFIHKTPVLTSQKIDELFQNKFFFKAENFQKVGAFKARGAMSALLRLSEEEKKRGVITHSSGNHGQALAYAGSVTGVSVTIVVPHDAPPVKIAAMKDYGAKLIMCAPGLVNRKSTTDKLINEFGHKLIHPYENKYIIMGQGTAALELIESIDDLDMIIAPIGGGGLLAGTSLIKKFKHNTLSVYGVNPANSDDAYRSFKSGIVEAQGDKQTIADGLRTQIGAPNLAIIRENVDDIFTATEESIIETLKIIWSRLKVVIEPSSALPLALFYEQPYLFKHKRVGIILSGGNFNIPDDFLS